MTFPYSYIRVVKQHTTYRVSCTSERGRSERTERGFRRIPRVWSTLRAPLLSERLPGLRRLKAVADALSIRSCYPLVLTLSTR